MMNVHTSLVSQPQYRPQARSAQMEPAMRVNVQNTNPTTLTKYTRFSSFRASGSVFNSAGDFLPASHLACSSWAMDSPAPMAKNAVPSEATKTWMISQYESSAGGSGFTGT